MSSSFAVEPAEQRDGIQSIGPFETHRVIIDGYVVPYLSGHTVGDNWYFSMESHSLEVPLAYGYGVASMIAHAMACVAGYSCFGENSRPLNQFQRRMFRITSAVSEIDAMEPEGKES